MFQEKRHFRIHLFLFLFLLLKVTFAFGQNSDLPNEVVITGKIIGADSSRDLSFRFYKDYLTFEEIHYSVSLDQDSFSIKIPISENKPGFVTYGAANIPIFLEKGNQIYLSSKATSFTDYLQYKGKGALANTYLKEIFLKFDVKDAQRIEEGIAKNTAQSYKHLVEGYKQEKLNYLDSFLVQRDTQFTEAFGEYVKADINYWFGNTLMRYRNEHPASDMLPVSLTLPDEYFQFMDSLELNNEQALSNIHYLYYLDHYAKWRQERIEKGLLQFKKVVKTKKKLIKIKMVETFGQVLIDQLEVRKEAHDAESTFAKLERGTEVLYLQDITNDRFIYPYNGHRYSDKFLKVETPDGRWGWVFNGGINLKEKIVYTKKWVEIPDTSPEIMRNFKYASFKGKVLQYAVIRDLYWNTQNGKEENKQLLKDYLAKAPENKYTDLLKRAYQQLTTDTAIFVSSKRDLPIPASDNTSPDASTQVKGMLKEITATTAKNLQQKKLQKSIAQKEKKEVGKTNPNPITANKIIAKIEIPKPDFSLFERVTSLKGMANSTALSRPEIIINTNPLLREGTTFPFPDRAAAHFHYDISLKSSTTAEIRMGKETIQLYLQAGDNMDITVNGNDLYKGLSFTGEGSDINNYLVTASKIFKDSELDLQANIRYAKPATFKKFLTQLKNEKLTFLRTYLDSHVLTAHAVKYARADIDYWYAFNLMNYPYEHPIFHNMQAPMDVPADYYDFMEEIPVSNSSALPNKNYIYYLQDYLSYQATKTENRQLSKYELADKYLEGKPLYFYKALQVSLEAKRDNDPNIEQKIADFINNCPYQIYEEYVKLAYHEGKGIVAGMEAPDFQLTDINGKSVSLADYKNKVIFLDFWATWCVPCVHQLPSHRKLQSQFAEEEVVFLYVSVDKNENLWRNFVQKRNLPGVHLSAGKNMFNSAVAKKYKVSSLPYTILIDAQGKIVWHHTGGYSVTQVGQRISELLP